MNSEEDLNYIVHEDETDIKNPPLSPYRAKRPMIKRDTSIHADIDAISLIRRERSFELDSTGPKPGEMAQIDIELHSSIEKGGDQPDGQFRTRSKTAPALKRTQGRLRSSSRNKYDLKNRRKQDTKSWLQRSFTKVQNAFLGTQLSTSYETPETLSSPDKIKNKPRLLQWMLRFMCSKPSKYKTIKASIGFVSGFLFTAALFTVFHFSRYLFEKKENVTPPENWGYATAGGIAFLLALGLTLSVAVRCIVVLMIPALFTNRGRAVLFAVVLQILLRGPVHNTTENTKLISESTSCQIELLVNQTNQILDFLVNKTTQITDQYKDVYNQIAENSLRSLRELVEIRIKLSRVINIGVVNEEKIGLRFQNLTIFIQDFKNYSNKANFTSYHESPTVTGSQSIQKLFKQITIDFTKNIKRLQTILDTLTSILPWTVALVFIQSFLYRRCYKSRIEYDNIYITTQFKNLDKKRKRENKQYLEPLRRRERSNLIDSTSCVLSKRELSSLLFAITIVLIFFFVGVFTVVVDYGLSTLMEMIHTYGDTTLKYRGGAGFIASLPTGSVSPNIRQLLIQNFPQVFDENSTKVLYEASVDTGTCLPTAIPPFISDSTNLILLVSLYTLLFVVSLLQAYGLRLQHKVAAYFYPEQEEKRFLYLYHSIRAQRVSVKGLLWRKIKKKFGDTDETDSGDEFHLSSYIGIRCPTFRRLLEKIGVLQTVDCSACGSEILSGGRKFVDGMYACDMCIENVKSSDSLS